jgi:hypothetical protein
MGLLRMRRRESAFKKQPRIQNPCHPENEHRSWKNQKEGSVSRRAKDKREWENYRAQKDEFCALAHSGASLAGLLRQRRHAG